ncbi:MAG: 50S ribosomal protein L7ae [Clostridiales bacterium]|nr:50S ribosomal protein L7ae [Clostridiales bacterium]
MNPRQSILSLMGLARKAGKLAMGNDAAVESMEKGETRLLILAGDLSPRTRRNIGKTVEATGVTAVDTPLGMDEISWAIGRRTGILSVNDEGFAKKMEPLCSELLIDETQYL